MRGSGPPARTAPLPPALMSPPAKASAADAMAAGKRAKTLAERKHPSARRLDVLGVNPVTGTAANAPPPPSRRPFYSAEPCRRHRSCMEIIRNG
jgi:hypothetical protein